MTEKEKNILLQELWALVAQDAEATTHCFKISLRQLKCITKEEANEMTPNKHKVVEELKLLWNFVKTIHEDLGKIVGYTDYIIQLTENFYLDARGIHFVFNEYEIACKGAGPLDIAVPFNYAAKLPVK